ncbi:hypothetical protein [Mesorhizobium sp. A623]
MSNVVALRARRQTDPEFGLCPECECHNGFLNKGSQHWFFCNVHRTRWLAGINLFDQWREENRAEQHERFAAIECFDVVQPIWATPKGAA